MHQGRIRESGTHEALLMNGGICRQLYELQFGDCESSPDAVRHGDGGENATCHAVQ